MNILVPAAGLSSRFEGTTPKWMLVHPSGKTMLELVLTPFLNKGNRIVLITTSNIERQNKVGMFLKDKFNDEVELCIVPYQTSSQSETVFFCLTNHFEERDVPFVIKDTDSYIDARIEYLEGGFVYGLDYREHQDVREIHNKSFLLVKGNTIVGIQEKIAISYYISTGLYGFETMNDFIYEYVNVRDSDFVGEIYPSKIIQGLISNGVSFEYVPSKDYKDWGTQAEWDREKNI